MSQLDTAIVQAPRYQFGLLNTSVSLNCSVSINDSAVIMWKNSTNSTHSGEFADVQLAHEGEYTCEVFLSAIDLIMTKLVRFTVIGKLSRFNCESQETEL